MATIKVDLKNYAAYQMKLGKEMHAAVLRGVRDGAARCIPILQAATEQAPPASQGGAPRAFDTGNYKRSWKVVPTEDGANVFNDAPYASVIEDGRRVGARQPPLSAIEAWARRKLYSDSGKGKLGPKLTPKRRASMAAAAAFPIARAIARRGLKPRGVMNVIAMPKMTEAMEQSIIKALNAAMAKVM